MMFSGSRRRISFQSIKSELYRLELALIHFLAFLGSHFRLPGLRHAQVGAQVVHIIPESEL